MALETQVLTVFNSTVTSAVYNWSTFGIAAIYYFANAESTEPVDFELLLKDSKDYKLELIKGTIFHYIGYKK